MIHTGDCVDVMAGIEPASIDAIVTDPPYNLGFMSKPWDIGHSHDPWAAAALRVARPGAYLLAFGGTRTVHRLTCALEDAGWIIRDLLVWAYAQGFPKGRANLKPAYEPIVLARKPGPLRELAIDACRIGITKDVPASASRTPNNIYGDGIGSLGTGETGSGFDPSLGRWPANIVLTDPIFDGGWEGVVGGGWQSGGGNPVFRSAERISDGVTMGGGWQDHETGKVPVDTKGTYSRFFLIPKASRADREPNWEGRVLEQSWFHQSGAVTDEGQNDGIGLNRPKLRRNIHPTVKPIELMRHLVRLVTPAGGVCLDPFLGSGTTAVACEMEGFAWIGIEREPEYVRIAEARLLGIDRGMSLTIQDAPRPPEMAQDGRKGSEGGQDTPDGLWAGTGAGMTLQALRHEDM